MRARESKRTQGFFRIKGLAVRNVRNPPAPEPDRGKDSPGSSEVADIGAGMRGQPPANPNEPKGSFRINELAVADAASEPDRGNDTTGSQAQR